MAVFTPDVDIIVTEAYERCGVDAETISDYQLDQGIRSMNFLLAEWSSRKTLAWRIDNWVVNMGLPDASNTRTDEAGNLVLDLPPGTIDILSIAVRYPEDNPSGSDIMLRRLSHEEYLRLPNKLSTGFPYQYLMVRGNPPKVILWRPADRNYRIYAWLKMAVDEVDNITHDDTVPYRFIEALVSGLACKLATKIAPDRLPFLDQQAMAAWEAASDSDDDGTGIQFIPARFM